jgi:hypothetical protein
VLALPALRHDVLVGTAVAGSESIADVAAFATPTEPQWARVVCSNDWSAWIDSRALKDA